MFTQHQDTKSKGHNTIGIPKYTSFTPENLGPIQSNDYPYVFFTFCIQNIYIATYCISARITALYITILTLRTQTIEYRSLSLERELKTPVKKQQFLIFSDSLRILRLSTEGRLRHRGEEGVISNVNNT